MYFGLSKHGNKSMSQTETNRNNIASNQDAINYIKTAVMDNKAMVYLSRSLIEENRQMILSNYCAAFTGNRQLANQNTDEITTNTYKILSQFESENEVENNFVNAALNGTALKALKHRSSLNTAVLEISEKMAEINSQLIEINQSIMEANESIVQYNATNIEANSSFLDGALSPSKATPEKNAEMIAYNTNLLEEMSQNVELNREKMRDLVAKSIENQDALLKNKAEISERRESIFANRRAMSENRRNI
tara:strand:+ start:839 stop:1585 length:747 start_codon:yes stop_codon:yes gene_type:complete